MVFHLPVALRSHRPMDRDDQCDTQSIGSTFSNNPGSKRPKTDQGNQFYDHTDEWHVVPSGGAKARSTDITYQPHPCRYDEYGRYSSAATTAGTISKDLGTKTMDVRQSKDIDIKHTGHFDKEATHNKGKGDRRLEAAAKESYASTVGKIGDNNGKLGRLQKAEKSYGVISNHINIGLATLTTTTDENNSGEKQASGNSNSENNNDNENKEKDTDNGKEKDNNEEVIEQSGDTGNSNDDDNNNEGGNGYEEQASQATPAFDGKVLQKFVIDFNIATTPAATIGFIHKQFIKEILTVAPFTTFIASNKRTIPTPDPITTVEQFPTNHFLHQKFFHRVDVRHKVSFTHDVYSAVTAMELKRRAMPFLQEHDMGMWSEEISNNTKVRVGWILNAHSKVTYRPQMTDKICKGIDEQKENYGDENNRLLNQLPKKMHHIEVQTRTVTHQGHQTVACCVMAYKPAAPVIRELLAMLDHDYLGSGTSIVSEAAARELDPGKYIEIINSNTAFHQNTRTISVKYVHDLFWGVQYRPCEQANYTTVREWILTGSGVVSIEPTKDTEKEGRYIILCKAEGFPVFRRLLQVMFQTLVKTIEEDENLKKVALNQFHQYPTIIGPHKIGKYAEKNAKGLLSRIDAPTVPKPAIRPPSNKIEFDFGSAEGFPDITNGIKARMKKPSAKKPGKQQSWATIAAPTVATTQAGTASVGSEPSEAGRSYRSARTGITTTDQQTTQSDAMSVLTEFISQARQEDAERRKEEREERRIDRADRKAEAEARRRNEDRRDESNRLMFQTMMATIMANNSRDTSTQVAAMAASPPTTPKHADNANLIAESNTKRARQKVTNEDTISSVTATQEENNTMEVEETVEGIKEVTGQQNHDVQKERNPSMIQ